MPSCLQEVKPQVVVTVAVGSVLLCRVHPLLNAVTCLETREGDQSEPQASLPAPREIKLSGIQSSLSITPSSRLRRTACGERLKQVMNSPYRGCRLECFSLPLTIPSLSNACSESQRNAVCVRLLLPNRVPKRDGVLAASRMRL